MFIYQKIMDSLKALTYDTLMTIPNMEYIEDEPLTLSFQYEQHSLIFRKIELKNSISDNISDFSNLFFHITFDKQDYIYHFRGEMKDISYGLLNFTQHYLSPLTLNDIYQFLLQKKEIINSLEYLPNEHSLLINEIYTIAIFGSFEQRVHLREYAKTKNKSGYKNITNMILEMMDDVLVVLDNTGYQNFLENFFKNNILTKEDKLMDAFRRIEKEKLDKLLPEDENTNKRIKL